MTPKGITTVTAEVLETPQIILSPISERVLSALMSPFPIYGPKRSRPQNKADLMTEFFK